MTTAPFQPFAPGFEFLQSLVKNAGTALPPMGQWVAPTLDPDELEKRIKELRTVQFWLEQNARMLGATIQALEVQKMTLSTLQKMNVQMGDLQSTLASGSPADAAVGSGFFSPTTGAPDTADDHTTDSKTAPETAAAAVDPMQWWGALTQQFGELASNAIRDGAAGLAAHTAAHPVASTHTPPTSAAQPAVSTSRPKKPAPKPAAAGRKTTQKAAAR